MMVEMRYDNNMHIYVNNILRYRNKEILNTERLTHKPRQKSMQVTRNWLYKQDLHSRYRGYPRYPAFWRTSLAVIFTAIDFLIFKRSLLNVAFLYM